MADYKVQMKQYNGTGFDNILPYASYASQAETLRGGGTASELITQARAGLCQIATGSYVGTGTYGKNNPTVINCGFKPKMVYICLLKTSLNEDGESNSATVISEPSLMSASMLFTDVLKSPFPLTATRSGIYLTTTDIYFSFTDNGISFYSSNALMQLNNIVSSGVYYYYAIG